MQEGEIGDGEEAHIPEHGEIDDLQGDIIGGDADGGKDGGGHITHQDAKNEGDQLHHLFAVDGEGDHGEQCDQTADQGDIGAAAGYETDAVHDPAILDHLSDLFHHNLAGAHIADGIACQRQTDDGYGGADDRGGHQPVDPLNTDKFDNCRDGHIDKTGQNGTDDQTHVTGGHRGGTCEGSAHGAQKRERGAQVNGTLKTGKNLIDQSSHTGAEEGGGLAHAVADDGGHGDGGGQDRQDLLQRKDQKPGKLRSVVNVIYKFHNDTSLVFRQIIASDWGKSKKNPVLFRKICGGGDFCRGHPPGEML